MVARTVKLREAVFTFLPGEITEDINCSSDFARRLNKKNL